MQSKELVINSLVLTVVSLFFMTSCRERHNDNKSNNNDNYGVSFNSVRDSLGLAALNENWEPYIRKKTEDDEDEFRIRWQDPNMDYTTIKDAGNYAWKTIAIEETTGKIKRESDVFLRPIDFINWGRAEYDYFRLCYTYVFIPDEYDEVAGWNYYLFIDNYDYREKTKIKGKITKHVADSILNSWGLSYPPKPVR